MISKLVFLIFLPARGHKQNQYGQKLQSACQHVKHQHVLGKAGIYGEILCRSYLGKAGSDIA